MQESADGPVTGYRATRSATFTKTSGSVDGDYNISVGAPFNARVTLNMAF